jgi:hypothetical protein
MTNIHAGGAESVELDVPIVPLSNNSQHLGKLSTRLFQGLYSVDIAMCNGTVTSPTYVDRFFKEIGRIADSIALKDLFARRTVLFLQGVATHEKDDEELQQLINDSLNSFLEMLKEINVVLDEGLPKELKELLTEKSSIKEPNLSKSGQRRAKRKLAKRPRNKNKCPLRKSCFLAYSKSYNIRLKLERKQDGLLSIYWQKPK